MGYRKDERSPFVEPLVTDSRGTTKYFIPTTSEPQCIVLTPDDRRRLIDVLKNQVSPLLTKTEAEWLRFRITKPTVMPKITDLLKRIKTRDIETIKGLADDRPLYH